LREINFTPVLTQNHVRGDDIDLGVLCRQGKIVCWTIRLLRHGRYQHVEEARSLRMAARLFEAVRFAGAAHGDARREEKTGDLSLIECDLPFWSSVGFGMSSGANFLEIGAMPPLQGPCRPCLCPGAFRA
jgi:hypothetical protein